MDFNSLEYFAAPARKTNKQKNLQKTPQPTKKTTTTANTFSSKSCEKLQFFLSGKAEKEKNKPYFAAKHFYFIIIWL